MSSSAPAAPGLAVWMRHDPAVRWLWRLIPLVAVNTFLIMGVSGALQRWIGVDLELPFSSVYLIWVSLLWIGLTGLLLSPGFRTRCDELSMTLPVPAASLWRAHLAAVLVAGVSLLATTVASMGIARSLLNRIAPGRAVLFEPGLGTLAWTVGVTFVLLGVILQAVAPGRRSAPLSRGYLLAVSASVPAGIGLILGLGRLPAAAGVIPLIAAVLVARARLRSVPPAFAVAPVALEGGGVREAGRTRPEHGARRVGPVSFAWRLFSLIWRDSNKKVAVPYSLLVLGAPMLFVIGLFLSSLLSVWASDTAAVLRLALVPMVWYTLIAFLWPGLMNLHLVDSLPVSRRRVFSVLVMPSLLVVALGLATGEVGSRVLRPTEPAVDFRAVDDAGHYWVLAPSIALAVRWGGPWPENTAPWGESHPPGHVAPLISGGRLSIYSPFSTPEGCSMEFVAWQLGRAITATYGTVIPPEELQRRYLQLDAAGAVVGREKTLPLLQDFPDLREQRLATRFPLMLWLVCVPFFLLLVPVLQMMREGVRESRRKAVLFGIMAACLLIYLGSMALDIVDVMDLGAVDGFLEISLRRMEARPGATYGIWTLSLISLAAGYELAYRKFLRTEFTRSAAGCLL